MEKAIVGHNDNADRLRDAETKRARPAFWSVVVVAVVGQKGNGWQWADMFTGDGLMFGVQKGLKYRGQSHWRDYGDEILKQGDLVFPPINGVPRTKGSSFAFIIP
ncbi:hypothetical protein CDAR_382141 [Caerostris darwini]|uniref:Uncharacterized protein n=1 Tax=Caerostris darwini TaxID=1538125 RepID=A0AAV4WNL4_9ARAC|nr:hypothetical protein CDAR_382141 [Caerostris darwini]